MVRQSAKKTKPDHRLSNVGVYPVTRYLLKKLIRAKQVPEIYKEVVRSQQRKNKFFRVPDDKFNSLHTDNIEENNEQLNNNAVVDHEQILTISEPSRHTGNCLNNGDPENETSHSGQIERKTTNCSRVCTSQDRDEELFLKHCAVQLVDLIQDFNSLTDSEGTIITMPQKASRPRKSISTDTRPVSSPGVITRSQLKQLANSKTVPEEYKNFISENHSPEGNGKQGKSDKPNQAPSNNYSATPRRRRSSCKQSNKDISHISFEQNSSTPQENDDHIQDVCDSLVENNISFSKLVIQTSERTRSKKKKQNEEKVDNGGLTNSRTVKATEEKVCVNDPNSVSITQNEKNSGKQTVSEMDVSEEEVQNVEESVEKLSKSPDESMVNDSTIADHTNKRNTLKRLVHDKAGLRRKAGKNRKIDNVKGQEILDKLHSKTQTVTARQQRVSICEPVDMSISEDCSGTEKILYCAKSSDSDASGTFVKHTKETPLDVSSMKMKTKGLKREKNNSSSKEATKSPEVTSATSSSYNSGYEITPSKEQSMSKECSLSTKTTDSGIAVMVDSNPYGETDSSTGAKQENHDIVQKLNIANHIEFKAKSGQSSSVRKTPIINNVAYITKQTNLFQNNSTTTSIGKPTQIRQQPFLLRMPVSVDEDIDSDSDAESRKAIMLSAQRRIEQNLSTTDSEGHKMSHRQTPSSSLHDGEDSDDAPPDSMTFEAGRNTATESLRDAVESISRDRQRRKERRRIRLEKLRQQKEEKLIRLKERLASQEDASCSSSEESGYEDEELRHFKKKPPSRDRSKAERERIKSKKRSSNVEGRTLKPKDLGDSTQMKSTLISSDAISKRLPDELLERLSEKAPVEVKLPQFGKTDEGSVNKNPTTTQMKRKKGAQPPSEQSDDPSDSQSFKKPPSLDYIPLKSTSSTKFGIMPFDKVGNISKTTAQKAAEFRQNMMFGNHHKREPANTNLIYQQKLKASGRDVLARKKY